MMTTFQAILLGYFIGVMTSIVIFLVVSFAAEGQG